MMTSLKLDLSLEIDMETLNIHRSHRLLRLDEEEDALFDNIDTNTPPPPYEANGYDSIADGDATPTSSVFPTSPAMSISSTFDESVDSSLDTVPGNVAANHEAELID
ncbi:MAG: hypothetical protein Q9224_005902, partial [Gallowayella concinna]